MNVRRKIIIVLFAFIVGILFYTKFLQKKTVPLKEPSREIEKIIEKEEAIPEKKEGMDITFPEEVFCDDFVEFACSLPETDIIDDNSGIYNLTLGKKLQGFTKKQQINIKNFENLFFRYFKKTNIEDTNCYDLVTENIKNMEKYWPEKCKIMQNECESKKNPSLCKKITQYSCYDAAEASCIEKRCDELDEEKVIMLYNCRKRVYSKIWEYHYSDIDSELARIFEEAVMLSHEVITENFPGEAEKFIVEVENARLATKEFYNNFTLNEGRMFLNEFISLENASFSPVQDSLYIVMLGLGTVERVRSKNVFMAIFAHELGHIIDPLRTTENYCAKNIQQLNIVDPVEKLKIIPNPFLCNDVPSSLKDISRDLLKKIDLYEYPMVLQDKTEIYTYLGEMFADWFSAMVLNKSLPYDVDLARKSLINIARLFCDDSLEYQDDGRHPKWKDRINKLYRAYLKNSAQLFKCRL